MKSKASPFVVAIASVSGGGKTTAVAGLTHVLSNTKIRDIKYYADRGRAAYLHMLETIRPSSDLAVDGTGSITAVVHSIAENKARS